MEKDFLELTQDEILSISGGMEKWKEVTYEVSGALLIGHSFLIGFVATPAAGVMAAGMGVKLFGKGYNANMERRKGGVA